MVKKVGYFTEPGKGRRECQDIVYFRENGDFGFYSLADGVNSVRRSRVGARAVQKALADEWEKNPITFFKTPIKEVQKRFIEIIHEVIYNLSEGKRRAEDYASTLLIVLVARKSGKFRWVHIGDGLIMKENCWGERDVVSYEHNGMTPQYTFTTTSEPLFRYLRMGEGNMNLVRRFLLFTDGAILPFYKDRKVTERGQEVIEKGPDSVHSALRNLRLSDDYSMLDILV